MTFAIPGEVLALFGELDEAITNIIERHFQADEAKRDILRHYGPLSVRIYNDNGYLARFYEEGVEFYPEKEE